MGIFSKFFVLLILASPFSTAALIYEEFVSSGLSRDYHQIKNQYLISARYLKREERKNLELVLKHMNRPLNLRWGTIKSLIIPKRLSILGTHYMVSSMWDYQAVFGTRVFTNKTKVYPKAKDVLVIYQTQAGGEGKVRLDSVSLACDVFLME